MKSFALLTVALTCFFAATAQVTIATENDSLLFVAVPNKVTLQSTKIPVQELTLQSDKGVVTGKDGNYVVQCPTRSGKVSLKVMHRQEIVASKEVNSVLVSDPLGYLAGDTLVNTGNIGLAKAQRFQALIVKTNYPGSKWRVINFRISVLRAGQLVGSYQNNGNNFSGEVKDLLKKLTAGDMISVEEIGVASAGVYERRVLPDVKVKIVQ